MGGEAAKSVPAPPKDRGEALRRLLAEGVNYQVQVRALNAAGTGPASQTAATPTATPTPRPPGP